MMSFSLSRAGIGLGSAAALAMALGTAGVTPAYADHGDMATGLILGLAGGVAIDQLANNAHSARPARNYVFVPPPHRRVVREYVYAPPPPAPASPLRLAFESQGRRERMAIQYQLMQDGFYTDTIDGAWGPVTAGALYHWARAHHREGMLTTRHGADRMFAHILG